MTTNAAAITLFGATGTTGRLIAAALSEADLPFRLAGRSVEKLAALSDSLPGRPGWLVADATRPGSLPPLFQDTRLLINSAGPFTDLGERVVAHAALGGVHYLDTTNELGFVYRARGYSEMAKYNGAALVPACAFEVALADCAAQLAAARFSAAGKKQPFDSADIVYWLRGKGASQGTRRSAVRSLATSWIAYRDGQWTGQIPGGRVQRVDMPGGPRYALSFPSCESITLPAHLVLQRVDTWMSTTSGARFWAPLLVPLFARLSRSALRGVILALASGGGAEDSEDSPRAGAAFTIRVQLTRGSEARAITLQGKDPYGLTAKIITYAARQITQPTFAQRGMLAPAQAVDPQAFLGYAQDHWGLTLQAEDV